MNVLSFKSVWKSYVDAIDLRDRGIGYVAAGGTNVAPSATGAGSLGVTVAASTGVGFIVNSATAFTTYAGGAITLTAADATNPRVDIVYFSSAGSLAKTDGTAAAIVPGVSGPVPAAWPAGCCPLAICLVPSTATDFTTGGYVMDVRCFRSMPTGTASSTTFWRGDNQWATAGGSGGTPALVLGTTNTPGVATTFIRDDDTILVFDATLPAAVGTAAVGTAVTAARRDHVHAGQKGAQSAKASISADITTSSTVFVAATGLTVTITTTGGDVLIWFSGTARNNGAADSIVFTLRKDNVDVAAGPTGLTWTNGSTANLDLPFSFPWRDTPTSASHTYAVFWKIGTGTNIGTLRGDPQSSIVALEIAH